MYQKILVPLDGSPLSETALGIALPLAHRHDASVEILHVHATPVLAGVARKYDTRLDAELRDAMNSDQSALAGRSTLESGVPVSAVFLEGDVISTIAEYAERSSPDIAVMTTHGRSGLSKLWLGSVTDAIVRKLKIPVLVVPGTAQNHVTDFSPVMASLNASAKSSANTAQFVAAENALNEVKRDALGAGDAAMFPRVLVPLDGSADAEAVLAAVSALVTPHEVTIALLCVVVPPVFMDADLDIGGGTLAPNMSTSAASEAEAVAYLADVSESLRVVGVNATAHVVVHQNAASAILHFAAASPFDSGNAFDLIALAPNERSTADRLLLGSVTDKVLRASTIPVLLHHHAYRGG